MRIDSATVSSFDVTIEKIVAGGDGLARHDGRVVFVPGSAPGERHRVEPAREKRDYLRARSVRRLSTSASRRDPPCPYYARCGGCSLMHLVPKAQLEAKKEILLESLSRAGIDPSALPPLEAIASPEDGYRTRLRFHVSKRAGGLTLGFRRRASHRVEDIEHCRLGSEKLNAAWTRVRRFLKRAPGRARDLASVELQESGDGRGRIVGRFVVRSRDGGEFRRNRQALADALVREAALDGVVVVDERAELRAGRTVVQHRVAQTSLRQSAGAFFQTNRYLLDRLVASVVDAVARATDVSRVVDLYCGVGLFTIPLSRQVEEAVGVEASGRSVADAIANARAAGAAGSVRFFAEDAIAFVRRWRFRPEDFVVVDPPRGGLPRGLREAVADSPIREACYVSCDPAAFGRDAAFFDAAGFRIRSLQLIDMFPNTHHFETVATFSRAPLDSVPRRG